MKRLFISVLMTGVILLLASIIGIYFILWQLPNMAMEYFGPAFRGQNQRSILYFIHPFVIAICLSWLWRRLHHLFKGPAIIKSLKFGMAYMAISTFPYMLLIYSAIDVSLPVILSWLIFGFVEATVAAIIFDKIQRKYHDN